MKTAGKKKGTLSGAHIGGQRHADDGWQYYRLLYKHEFVGFGRRKMQNSREYSKTGIDWCETASFVYDDAIKLSKGPGNNDGIHKLPDTDSHNSRRYKIEIRH